ncbi:PilZ domain-containing protein [Glaciecola petra]|uniref:PilZ domain-containing protein n=1 Tax=Glaciecola petra TaxID=3075602 RepID=A0ABU2ZT27_9ALTE|nr:PilZ domain-containing protein [Aestuariibacter sp. P117]MDT0595797.1 PilZ domain-containing protein [Aestuariibacter sp. P117]
MTDRLESYEALIQALAPLVSKANFNVEFEQRTKSIPQDTRFLIKMELKRLAKPCIRSIDLRTIVKDECRLFHHHGIDHYLNVNGILHFEKLVKRYEEYTFGVYENVLKEAEKEKQSYLVSQKKGLSKTEMYLPDEKYITPCQELLNFPVRKQERLNYVVAVEIFFADKSSIHASTLDISVNGLRVKLKDNDKLSKFKTFEPLQIVLRGLDKNLGLSRESIEYQALNVSGDHHKTQIHLYRDGSKNPLFDDFVQDLIRVHKHRYKVNLDNVEMALASKIYEQSFANNTPTLPVFICRDDEKIFCAKYASMNTCNKPILDFWEDEKGQQVIGFLLNPNRLHRLINDNNAYPQMTIYCFNHIKDEKVYFYSASEQELAESSELRSTFLSYGARKVSWRVYHLTVSDVLPNQGYSPTSIPDGVNKRIDRMNQALSPRLKSKIDLITNMVSVTDITNDIGQACYQTQLLHKHKIRLLSQFGHARNKLPHFVETYRHTQKELRRQTRYTLRTPITIKTNNQLVKGVTEDVSISGLKIELDEAITQRLNSKVNVSFSKLQKITDSFDLHNLRYKVVHINIDKNVLHLQASAEDENNVAENFFTHLIEHNSDKLTAIQNEEPVSGLSIALRNIHSKNSPQFCAYVEKKVQGYLPAMSSASQVRTKWMEFLHHDKSLALVNLGWLYQDIDEGNDFVNQTLKLLRIDPTPIKSEIFVAAPAQSQFAMGIRKAKWQYQFPHQRARQSFIKQAINAGEFLAFSVTINKAIKPDLEKIEQELLYLSQHAVHKATYFEERLWDIAGNIFLTDITQEVLTRYKLR